MDAVEETRDYVCVTNCDAAVRRQVPNPYAKLVVGARMQEHVFDEKICHRKSHAGKSPHEGADLIGKILIKRATIPDCIHPMITMTEPMTT